MSHVAVGRFGIDREDFPVDGRLHGAGNPMSAGARA